MELYPYGRYLQEALDSKENTKYIPSSVLETAANGNSNNLYNVTWKGYSGWTAYQLEDMVKYDLAEVSGGNSIDLAILLAGTNDLGHGYKPEAILEHIQTLHAIFHDMNIPTIALSVPTSKWQENHPEAAKSAQQINEQLEDWAKYSATTTKIKEDRDNLATYVPYPIQSYDSHGEKWCRDGLHLTKLGYEFVGASLVPVVAEMVWKEE